MTTYVMNDVIPVGRFPSDAAARKAVSLMDPGQMWYVRTAEDLEQMTEPEYRLMRAVLQLLAERKDGTTPTDLKEQAKAMMLKDPVLSLRIMKKEQGAQLLFDALQLHDFGKTAAGVKLSKPLKKEQVMKTIDVKAAKTGDLVTFYNAHVKKIDAGATPIKKFADRATAEKRVTELMKAINPSKKKDKTSAPKKERAGSIAEGVKASWANETVAAARAVKNKVKVGGEVYRSVLQAFQELKLDVNKHIKFRAELKAKGRATFEGNVFTIVPNAEA